MKQITFDDVRAQQLRVPDELRPEGLSDSVRMRWVPDYRGLYAVTSSGSVFSFHREDPSELSPGSTNHGYRQVHLSCDGDKEMRYVHRLVLLAFAGPPKDGEQCRHLNGDRNDNSIGNLTWGTPKENHKDMRRHGNHRRGESHKLSKLCEEDVIEIRERRRDGEKYESIAQDYPVRWEAISKICRGKRWAHVDQ